MAGSSTKAATTTGKENPTISRNAPTTPKRRRRSTHSTSPPRTPPPPNDGPTTSSGATSKERWRWVFHADGVALCFVKDVFDMVKKGSDNKTYFYLGRVPCLYVNVVGTVVGVTVYEKRVVYTLDDGTGVIDCPLREPANTSAPQDPIHASPKKKRKIAPFSTSHRPAPTNGPPPGPTPLAKVGDLVRIIAKVVAWRDEAQLSVQRLERCKSANDEPRHILAVIEHHRTKYDLSTPFDVPAKFKEANNRLTTPRAKAVTQEPPPPTPIAPTSAPSAPALLEMSAATTPSVMTASSPAKSEISVRTRNTEQIRHPSRLHTRDLTKHTFLSYCQHYIKHARPLPSYDESDDDSDTDADPTTPTKRSQSHSRTPRRALSTRRENQNVPSSTPPSPHDSFDATPRPSAKRKGRSSGRKTTDEIQGFTLSYLRRVPELAQLAQRIVVADRKREEREERRAAKAASQLPSSSAASSSSSSRAPPSSSSSTTIKKLGDRLSTSQLVKRMFQHVIRQLYSEGAICMWEGPILPLPSTPLPLSEQSYLWKSRSSDTQTSDASSSVPLNTAAFSSASRSRPSATSATTRTLFEPDEDDGALSDPPSHEESFVPTTPAALSAPVLAALQVLAPSGSQFRSQPFHANTTHRGTSVKPKNRYVAAKISDAPTPIEITAYLKRRDELWANIGDWVIKDVLEYLRGEGKVWCVGTDRWDLCL